MKRYLVLDEPYGFKGGIIGSVDSLDDIPYPNSVGAVIDTAAGKVYEYTGVEWELNENIPDGMEIEEEVSKDSEPERHGVPYWVDLVNGSDDNDGLDICSPLKTLEAAMQLRRKSPGRSKIYVVGDKRK